MQNSFGGNCKTSMIFVVSPAADNHDQTLSTLRFAAMIRKVVNKPTLNQFTDKNQPIQKDIEQKMEIIHNSREKHHENINMIVKFQSISQNKQTEQIFSRQEQGHQFDKAKNTIKMQQTKHTQCPSQQTNIKVAIRIRPFSTRQYQIDRNPCLEMNQSTIRLYDLEGKQKAREFTFNNNFRQHGFFKTPTGYDHQYINQKQVFGKIGIEAVNDIFEGYNSSIITYGQTGAGKRFTMFGPQEKKGIIPRVLEQISDKIQQNQKKTISYKLNMSVFQIYNQEISDLLTPIKNWRQKQLKVIINNKKCTSIQNLTKHQVTSTKTSQHLLKQALKNQCFARSYLSHTPTTVQMVVQLELIQEKICEDKTNKRKISVMKMVSLGGSQRRRKMCAVEGKVVEDEYEKRYNAMRNVIEGLSEKSVGSGNKTHVPYQDSLMTQYLQDALGGNCKTYMIFVVSPAFGNYDQTLKNLVIAQKVSKITNNVKVNQWKSMKNEVLNSSKGQKSKNK